MDDADRRRICQLVAGILVSDEHLSAPEESFLQRVFARFGLPPEEWGSIAPVAAGPASAELRALPRDLQAKVLALLVEAALADGEVDVRERVFLLVAAAALQIDADQLEQRIAARLESLKRLGPTGGP